MLSRKQIQAARHLAEGWRTRKAICRIVGIDRATIFDWQKLPEFITQVDAFQKAYKRRIRERGIASVENRIRLYNQLHAKWRRVIRERGKAMKDVPGGSTGLLVRRQKMLGSGPNATIVEEVEADTALTKELRETLLQAAKELGQFDKAGEDDAAPDRVIRVRPVKPRAKPAVDPA